MRIPLSVSVYLAQGIVLSHSAVDNEGDVEGGYLHAWQVRVNVAEGKEKRKDSRRRESGLEIHCRREQGAPKL